MTDETPLTSDNEYQIDFNFQQVPSALAVDIPSEAAAAMLHITPAQFNSYAAFALADCKRIARELLESPRNTAAIEKLKRPRTGTTSTVMTIGDSITTYRYGYAEILGALLELVAPAQPGQFYNHGRSGYTSTHGLEHTFTQYLAQKPDWVFLKYGVNDTKRFGGAMGKLLVSSQEYAHNMAHIIDALLSVGAHVVILTPTPVIEAIVNANPDFQAMAMTWDNRDILAYANVLNDIGTARGVPVIDLMSIFTVKPDPSLHLPDGLHPGPVGHRIIIEQVLKTVDDL